MKKYIYLLLAILIPSSFLVAQDMNMEEMQRKWMAFMQPGEIHEMLKEHEGEWTIINKFWMYPGSEVTESNGMVTNKMILGGRYLMSEHSGNVMGMPMEGISLMGYDNAKQEVFSLWIDNLGTGIAFAKGSYDKKSNTIFLEGSMTDPSTDEDAWFREEFKIIDENNQVMKMFMKHEGREFKNMEIEFRRK